MDTAIQYTEQMNAFVATLLKIGTSVEVHKGRKFDRIEFDSNVEYFVDRNTWSIYGAKSPFQYNPRRVFGTLSTIEQFDWSTNTPLAGTPMDAEFTTRENAIQAGYKKRGRPRKIVHIQPTSIPKEIV
jgi:hypothetical protein